MKTCYFCFKQASQVNALFFEVCETSTYSMLYHETENRKARAMKRNLLYKVCWVDLIEEKEN